MRNLNPNPSRDEPDAAYAAGLRLLVRREHSAVELMRKLKQRGFIDAAVDPAIERLRTEGSLSDDRYAEAMARHRLSQGYGVLRIRAELAQQGVAGDRIEAAIDALEADWRAQAQAQARRHFAHPPDTPKARQRVLRYLTQRGFTAAMAHAALENWEESVQESR